MQPSVIYSDCALLTHMGVFQFRKNSANIKKWSEAKGPKSII